MSALARYFNSRGIKVSGYDKTSTTLTKQLQQEGISMAELENIPGTGQDGRVSKKDILGYVGNKAVSPKLSAVSQENETVYSNENANSQVVVANSQQLSANCHPLFYGLPFGCIHSVSREKRNS